MTGFYLNPHETDLKALRYWGGGIAIVSTIGFITSSNFDCKAGVITFGIIGGLAALGFLYGFFAALKRDNSENGFEYDTSSFGSSNKL